MGNNIMASKTETYTCVYCNLSTHGEKGSHKHLVHVLLCDKSPHKIDFTQGCRFCGKYKGQAYRCQREHLNNRCKEFSDQEEELQRALLSKEIRLPVEQQEGVRSGVRGRQYTQPAREPSVSVESVEYRESSLSASKPVSHPIDYMMTEISLLQGQLTFIDEAIKKLKERYESPDCRNFQDPTYAEMIVDRKAERDRVLMSIGKRVCESAMLQTNS